MVEFANCVSTAKTYKVTGDHQGASVESLSALLARFLMPVGSCTKCIQVGVRMAGKADRSGCDGCRKRLMNTLIRAFKNLITGGFEETDNDLQAILAMAGHGLLTANRYASDIVSWPEFGPATGRSSGMAWFSGRLAQLAEGAGSQNHHQ
ncbi:hypothetical protein MLPF_2001 [Mycobacterium lepromatosis]|nr:hypothetical protein MLPF_2001 [Mycobacterium lepromatosis]